jgi:hypothetical protein
VPWQPRYGDGGGDLESLIAVTVAVALWPPTYGDGRDGRRRIG